MRVLLIIKRFDFGGAENHVSDLANALSGLGNSVYIVARKGRQTSKLNSDVRIIPLYLSDYLLPLNILVLGFVIYRNKIQVIHAHQRLSILVACLVGKILKTPVVATVHGRTRFDLKSKFVRHSISRIIFVSQKVMDVSKNYEDIKTKSFVVPNGIEIRNTNSVINKYSISYISRIDKKHSSVISMLINEVVPSLLLHFPRIELNIVGEGKCLKLIKDEASILNKRYNRKVCSVLGYIPELCDVLDSTGLVLGVGRVALEALSIGIPVISVNQKRLGSLITTRNYQNHRINNFVDVNAHAPNSKTFYDLLYGYFNNIEYSLQETKIVSDFVKADFDLSVIAERTLSIYHEALSDSNIN